MSQRNDAAAVTKAAKAVDRDDVVALLQLATAARLARLARRKPRPSPMPNDFVGAAPAIGSPESAFGEDGELRVNIPTPMRAPRARRNPRRAAGDMRLVTLSGRGAFPRFGTARYAKADFVRRKVRANDEAGKATHVFMLVGAYYDVDNHSNDRLTLHDLEVMLEKRIINMEDPQ